MKVILNPIKECYINQIVESNIQDMTKIQILKDSKFLAYCNGLVFYFEDYESEDIEKKFAEGIWYIQTFCYTKSKKNVESKYNGIPLEIIDLSNYPIFQELTKSILELEEK